VDRVIPHHQGKALPFLGLFEVHLLYAANYAVVIGEVPDFREASEESLEFDFALFVGVLRAVRNAAERADLALGAGGLSTLGAFARHVL
jgi:hypothetical protein